MYEGLVRKPGNGGAIAAITVPWLVTTTAVAVGDLLHIIPLGRSFYVTKIMWYQNTGAAVTLQFGSRNNAAVPAFVPYFPTILAVNGIDGEMREEELAGVEFILDNAVAPNGRDGNLYVVSSAAAVLVSVEVAEKGG